MHVCWKGTLLNPMKNTFLKFKNCNYMEKMFLMLLVAALTAFSNVEAQTSNNFLEEIKKANLLEGDILKKLSELSMNLNGKAKPVAKSKAKAAELRASEVSFTERVRIP